MYFLFYFLAKQYFVVGQNMKKRSLRVQMLLDIYSGSMSHALSTEKEEIMGLLVGFVDNDDDGKEVVVTVVAAKILQRLDKRKDRVEIRFIFVIEAHVLSGIYFCRLLLSLNHLRLLGKILLIIAL